MVGEPVTTIVGNLTGDPDLSFTQSGAAVANFTVASTPRTLDRQSGQWQDGEALFMRCAVWREYAENVAESLQKGMRVIVTGRLKQRSYDTQDGQRRTVVEMDVEEVGPALRYATASVNKTQRRGGPGSGPGAQGGGGNPGGGNSGGYNNGGGYNNSGGQGGGMQRQSGGQGGGQDPWSTGPAGNPGGQGQGGGQNAGGDWGGTFDDEPPF